MKLKKWMLAVVCVALLTGSLKVQAEETVKPSNVNYKISFRNASNIFIGNEKKVDWKPGDLYFLTYTVKEVKANENSQSGLITTTDPKETNPYTKGSMQYVQDSIFCEEGYTYFFRFEVKKDGWTYVAAKAKGEKSEYIELPHVEGSTTGKTPYFGVWLGEGGGITATLTRVRCYNQNGKDLGVNAPTATSIDESELFPLENVNHTYSFSVEDAYCIAFGSAKKTESDAVFLEYKISNVKASGVNQSGAIMTNNPTDGYPHGNAGMLNYGVYEKKEVSPLISEGARYLVRFERGKEKFDVLVKRTLPNGKVDYIAFPYYWGEYQENLQYVSMWIGEMCSLTADFTEVKCYDEDGNNLGIQTNKGVKVKHFGELEDYSRCEAVYYCEANRTFLSLDDEKNASKYVDGAGNAEQGKYKIEAAVMTLAIGEAKEEFEYHYNECVDKDGNRYVRMQEYTVTYLSDRIGGEVLEEVKVKAEDGFKALKPQEPSEKGRTFVTWVTGQNEEYDFNQVVTEATELYASWDGDSARTAVGLLGLGNNMTAVIVTAGVCVLLVAGTAVAIAIMKGRKKHGTKKKNE